VWGDQIIENIIFIFLNPNKKDKKILNFFYVFLNFLKNKKMVSPIR
jgi:hypothetical protein